MTINVHLWGPNPPQAQLKILNTFNSPAKLQGAFKMGQDACLSVLTGIVNHMAPGGQRMRELSSVSLLNQRGGKKRMLRSYSSSACVVSDYMKGEHVSDLDTAFWFAAAEVSCCIFRLAIFLKPILYQVACRIQDESSKNIPYVLCTHTVRRVNDAYNDRLTAAGLPTCAITRHFKECIATECAARISDSPAVRTYSAAVNACHSDNMSKRHYAIDLDTHFQVHTNSHVCARTLYH